MMMFCTLVLNALGYTVVLEFNFDVDENPTRVDAIHLVQASGNAWRCEVPA